jgi:hypothetical protein
MEKNNYYIYANIRLPIEIFVDGKYNIHDNRIQIEFENCNELPPISQEKNETIMEKIQSIISNNSEQKIQWTSEEPAPETEPILPSPTEIKIYSVDYLQRTPKKRINTTFKEVIKKKHMTRKVMANPNIS